MNEKPLDLEHIRKEIDSLDQKIHKLIVQRAELVETVGNIKKHDSNAIFYRPEREALVLKKAMERDCGRVPPKVMAKLFREIMSVCLALQKPVQVAFLGPEGTFSQMAVLKQFGLAIQQIPCATIAEVFSQVEQGDAEYGVVPIENSIGGLVEATFNDLIKTDLMICGELTLPITQCLLQKNPNEAITKIYSHQQSLTQCQQWLSAHYPKAELIAVDSNALAAELAAKNSNSAVIAGSHAAKTYGLSITQENIADTEDNFTRFLVIGYHKPQISGDDRTTLLIKVDDAPGALEKLINPLAKHGINITLIRSKPANSKKNSYYFFLDLDCHQSNENFIKAKKELEIGPMSVKILGSYPKAVL